MWSNLNDSFSTLTGHINTLRQSIPSMPFTGLWNINIFFFFFFCLFLFVRTFLGYSFRIKLKPTLFPLSLFYFVWIFPYFVLISFEHSGEEENIKRCNKTIISLLKVEVRYLSWFFASFYFFFVFFVFCETRAKQQTKVHWNILISFKKILKSSTFTMKKVHDRRGGKKKKM